MINRIAIGVTGEDLAVDFLKNKGYHVLERNYTTKLGEIDIIARDHGVFCFIEVKTRKSLKYGSPLEAISKAKRRKISQVALMYIKQHRLWDFSARFDVVGVINSREGVSVQLVQNAFELDPRHAY